MSIKVVRNDIPDPPPPDAWKVQFTKLAVTLGQDLAAVSEFAEKLAGVALDKGQPEKVVHLAKQILMSDYRPLIECTELLKTLLRGLVGMVDHFEEVCRELREEDRRGKD